LGSKREDGEFAGVVNRVPAADDLRSNMVSGGGAKRFSP
jgi:glutathione synthase